MELGVKLKQARLAAGLSQRQLCGETITRNMLSQIENGSASPSMGTLRYLAERLGLSVSYFLEEDGLFSPNRNVMDRARAAWETGDHQTLAQVLGDYRSPDPVYEPEYRLLCRVSGLAGAEDALEKGQDLLAVRMLEEMGEICDGYCSRELERSRLLLLGKAKQKQRQDICLALPSLDEELLLRAEAALEGADLTRSEHLLESVQNREDFRWLRLRGEVHLTKKEYEQAIGCFLKVEESSQDKLERCYRELGNFERAYYYACKQRERG